MPRRTVTLLIAVLAVAAQGSRARAAPTLPDGHGLTPLAAPGATFRTLDPHLPAYPDFRPGQALNEAVSPDGGTLLVMTSGFNNLANADPAHGKIGGFDRQNSTEYVFVYDIAGAHRAAPSPVQVLRLPDTFAGLVFAPDGKSFYASGGADDVVYRYSLGPAGFAQSAAIGLGHHAPEALGKLLYGGLGFKQDAVVSNLALDAAGKTLVAVNTFNASVSVVDTQSGRVLADYDLRPFHTDPARGGGVAGGETPFGVALAGGRAYVASLRDRDVTVLDLTDPAMPRFVARIALQGTPDFILPDDTRHPARLYVAQDNSDQVAVIDPATNSVIEEIDVRAPPGIIDAAERYTGAAPNHLALSPDGTTLYVSNGGQNAVAVVPVGGAAPHRVAGLIPTGWYPHAVATGSDGKFLYVVNGRSDPGPNPKHLSNATALLRAPADPSGGDASMNKRIGAAARASNQYVLQLEQAGLLALPVPPADVLARLTSQVAENDRYRAQLPAEAGAVMQALRRRIRHVIYIVKENRTFDQILGDLRNGADADPRLAMFGAAITPNLHAAAENFVTFDNFYDASEVSGNGWEWTTAARETDSNAKFIPMEYAHAPFPNDANHGERGTPYDAEGQNEGVDVGIPTLVGREAAEPGYAAAAGALPGGVANLLPGTGNDAAPDGPDGAEQQGYLWNAARRAHLSMRNYGFYIDLEASYRTVPDPFAQHAIQAYPTDPTLAPVTDPYFRSFDNAYPDYWRFLEWRREFRHYAAGRDLPRLTFLRYMHDHMGDFAKAVAGVNFPEAQQADDDYAVGLTLQEIAHSRYARDTLVFVVEDDAQDGPDHVDAHRSTAYIVGPYVRQHAVDHARYSQVSMLRTIEDVLELGHLNLNDATAAPMWTAFDLSQRDWTFDAVPSAWLRQTTLLPQGTKYAASGTTQPAHSARWWAERTRGYDWSHEDRAPTAAFNQLLWAAFGPH